MKTLAFLAVILAAVTLQASDITRGTTFVDGQVATAADLHLLVDDATINPEFLTAKPTATSLADADKFLVYVTASGVFKQVAANVVTANAGNITNRTEKTVPAVNDLVLIFDAGANALKKSTLGNVVSNAWSAMLGVNTNAGALSPGVSVLVWDGSAWQTATRSNLLYNVGNLATLTNVPYYTTPTNTDALLLVQGATSSNKLMRIEAIYTNNPVSSVTLTDSIPVLNWQTNPATTNMLAHPASVTVSNLVRAITNAPAFTAAISNSAPPAITRCMFSGGASPTLLNSVNVSNVTRTGTSPYTYSLTFSNAFANTNYIISVLSRLASGTTLQMVKGLTVATNSLTISFSYADGGNYQDITTGYVIIYP